MTILFSAMLKASLFGRICFTNFWHWSRTRLGHHRCQIRHMEKMARSRILIDQLFVWVWFRLAHVHMHDRQPGYQWLSGSRQIANFVTIGDFGEQLGKHCTCCNFLRVNPCSWITLHTVEGGTSFLHTSSIALHNSLRYLLGLLIINPLIKTSYEWLNDLSSSRRGILFGITSPVSIKILCYVHFLGQHLILQQYLGKRAPFQFSARSFVIKDQLRRELSYQSQLKSCFTAL